MQSKSPNPWGTWTYSAPDRPGTSAPSLTWQPRSRPGKPAVFPQGRSQVATGAAFSCLAPIMQYCSLFKDHLQLGLFSEALGVKASPYEF